MAKIQRVGARFGRTPTERGMYFTFTVGIRLFWGVGVGPRYDSKGQGDGPDSPPHQRNQ